MFLKCISDFILEFTPSTAHLYPPPPQITGLSSSGLISALTCMCTHFLLYVLPPTTFPGHILPSHWYQPCSMGKTFSTLLFSNFAEEKKKIKRKA
jgi:hypothetical protein